MNKIYLDNASTTQMIDEAYEIMLPHFKQNFANASSVYKFGKESKREIEKARESIANSIGAKFSRELYFTASGTEANNWVLKSLSKKGSHIITSQIEHHSILKPLKFLERQGVSVTYLPVTKDGLVTPEVLESAITGNTSLISIMFANNEIGTIQPIAELSKVAKKHNILFHTDAVSALGSININVQELGVDFLTISAHKVYGPKGVGALYVNSNVELPAFIHGGAQERGRRAGTEPVPLIISFAKALEVCLTNMETEKKRLHSIAYNFIEKILVTVSGSNLNGPPITAIENINRLSNIINFSFENINGEDLIIMLDNEGFICSSGSACTAGSLEFSHVLTALGISENAGSLRISLGLFNREEDLEKLAERLPLIIEKLRGYL
ncbi:MAG: cysteine desulfurase [Defluviitaleaceae bacterium]|nr:cysteine desulfurase [Defluviitaleaceae bacterium]